MTPGTMAAWMGVTVLGMVVITIGVSMWRNIKDISGIRRLLRTARKRRAAPILMEKGEKEKNE